MYDPAKMLFSKTHEWVFVQNGKAVIGITDHAQNALGDITYVELPEAGTVLSAGEEIGVVESVKAASDLYTPVGGSVAEVNADLADHPENINNDPYGDGWMLIVDVESVPDTLLDLAAYNEFCESEEH
ncbi:MAG: glycine cleavage system protein GcvH [Mailhella sp.]|nr:glycine cleavage system protein GcvH [Mailhella sp.]